MRRQKLFMKYCFENFKETRVWLKFLFENYEKKNYEKTKTFYEIFLNSSIIFLRRWISSLDKVGNLGESGVVWNSGESG